MQEKKYYAVPFISNSTLSWFKTSPKYCWKRMNQEIVDEEKSYTYLGRQIHMSILEPEEFSKNYTYLDFNTPTSKQQIAFCNEYVRCVTIAEFSHEDALRFAYSYNYVSDKKTPEAILKSAEIIYESCSEYIEYLKIRGDYREVLSKSKKELITTITEEIKRHKLANYLLFDQNSLLTESFNEIPIYWDYPIYWDGEPLKCKSLLDRLVVDHQNRKTTIVDLKTTSTIGDVSNTIRDYEYYRQLAYYRLALQHSNIIPKDYVIDAYIVAVSTQDPYECRVYKLSEAEYLRQSVVIGKLMQEISWHWFTNKWDYSRTYYEGDGTENLLDEYSIQSDEGNSDNIRSNESNILSFADVVQT